jgi:uncharacterized integral membrane protein
MPSDPPQQSTTGKPRDGKARPAVDRRFQSKTIAAIVVAVLIIAFAVANSQKVQVHFIVTTAQTPLVLVIVIAILLGFALGQLTHRRMHRPPKRGAGV